jgi:hypothetical protein
MTPVDAAILVLALALGFLRIINRELDKVEVEDLRRCGIVIVRERALEARSRPIGEYLGHPIWASVRFSGIDYRFDHVLDRRARERIAPGELYIEPGLVYVTGRG